MSPRARALLETYRREQGPTPEALQRARAALMARAGQSAEQVVSTRGARWWRRQRWLVVSTLALVGLGGALQSWSAPAATPRVAAPAPRLAPPPPPEPTAGLAVSPPDAAPVAPPPAAPVPHHHEPLGRGRRHRGDALPAARSARVSKPLAVADPAPVTLAPPSAPTRELDAPAPHEGDDIVAEIVAAHAGATTTVRVAKHRIVHGKSQSEDDSLDAEVKLIRQVYELLKEAEPARALALLQEHSRRFRFAKLQELAEVGRIRALCDLGHTRDARRLADSFLLRHEGSIHAARVRALCLPRP